MATRKKSRSLLTAVMALALLVAVSLGGWWLTRYRQFSDGPLRLADAKLVLVVERGDGFRDVLVKLRRLGVREGSELEWRLLALELDAVSRLQVGDYHLDHGLSPRALLQKLAQGDVIQRRFTIIEGWSFQDLRDALSRDPVLSPRLSALSDAEVMVELGRSGTHPEGRFLPETYHYTRGMSDLDVLQRALLAMDRVLADAWATRSKDLPLRSPSELLTLASIVEKETGRTGERPQIAGVFVRRLQRGMRLQTDPTVIYGIGAGYDGNIRKRDLDADTPYNTYTRTGLPPTPIALPGREALMAAAQPAAGDALYFVARGDGSHVFSASLAAHSRAVACHQLKRCP